MRIMWFPEHEREEAIALAERMAKDNGCTAKGKSGEWEMFNPACPDKNAVVVQKAKQCEPNGPEGYEVALRCNVYGERERWPSWLAEQGIMPGQRHMISDGGIKLVPEGEVVFSGGVTRYRVTQSCLRRIQEVYGPPPSGAQEEEQKRQKKNMLRMLDTDTSVV
ncbi:MAG: hypothetical protein K6U04_08725 [Armatimonadetes bacterium]|nr:hypothetical protein [Armatimonadota bacterium]